MFLGSPVLVPVVSWYIDVWFGIASLTYLVVGCLLFGATGMIEPSVSLPPADKPKGSSLWGFNIPNNSKKKLAPMFKHLSSLCLPHTCYCSIGQSMWHSLLEPEVALEAYKPCPGVSYTSLSSRFEWHGLFSIIGKVVTTSNCMMVERAFWNGGNNR